LADFLLELAEDARRRVAEGYYATVGGRAVAKHSITEALLSCKQVSVIAEIKFASPSRGVIRRRGDVEEIARAMENGGAAALSVLTEPKYFNGSIEKFIQAKEAVRIPILMKDIIVSPKQLDAACDIGADGILLIKSLFDRGLCELNLHQMIKYAQSKRLEVLLETHTDEEFSAALNLPTDIVGINNRNLSTLKVDIAVTEKILEQHNPVEKVVISESGIRTSDDIRLLHRLGVNGFLIGSEIMHSENIEEKVREFVMALG
jgi:indole-3-glycerol phosphate synthase